MRTEAYQDYCVGSCIIPNQKHVILYMAFHISLIITFKQMWLMYNRDGCLIYKTP